MGWLKPKAKIEPPATARAPEGEVLYAIGDVHGRADLLEDLLDQIRADAEAHPGLRVRVIALGDYVDRGSQSRRVIDLLIDLKRQLGEQLTLLRGNHESAMLDFLASPKVGPTWAEYGGRDTLMSYGVVAPRGRKLEDWTAAREAFLMVFPPTHQRFLENLQSYAQFGDYIFVHAGLKPRVPLAAQSDDDMLWIREEFLTARCWHDQVVVHGHTPFSEPAEAAGRIGVDTGAYATGVLTAVRLEADQRRYLRTQA